MGGAQAVHPHRAAAAVAAALALVVAPSALAARAPTKAERAALTRTFTAFVHRAGSPAARDNRIVTLKVSTVDARYAAALLFSPSAGPSTMVFHRGPAGWTVVGFGSSPRCSVAPKRVRTDLRIGCSP